MPHYARPVPWLIASLFVLSGTAKIANGQVYARLVREETTVIQDPMLSTFFTIPPVCDSEGDVYFHVMKSNDVEEVSPQGRVERKFSLGSVPASDLDGITNATFWSYAVGGDGTVYEIVWAGRGKNFVVEFNSDGTYERAVTLDVKDFSPYKLTPLSGASMLVSGFVMTSPKGGSIPVPKAYTGVFDSSGGLVKKLDLTGDVSVESVNTKATPSTELASSGFKSEVTTSMEVENAIETGTVAVGLDGNAYVVRNTNPPTVYVVSPAARLVRKMKLQPPAKGLLPIADSLSGSSLLIVYGTHGSERGMVKPSLYALYNLVTGDLSASYQTAPEVSGVFACRTQDAFLFIGATPVNRLTLVRAVPE